jgi:hypothetical protein
MAASALRSPDKITSTLHRFWISLDAVHGYITLKEFIWTVKILKERAFHVVTDQGIEKRVPLEHIMAVRSGASVGSIRYFSREIICAPGRVNEAQDMLRTAVEEEILLRKKHLNTMINLWQNRFASKDQQIIEENEKLKHDSDHPA